MFGPDFIYGPSLIINGQKLRTVSTYTQTNTQMKRRLESADMSKLPPQIGKLSKTDKWLYTKHKKKRDGGITGNVTLMRMFKNLFWITPYFSSKLDVLDIFEHILLLLDILAIIYWLFHRCNRSIKTVRIFISNCDLSVLKNCSSILIALLFHRIQVYRFSSFWMTGIQNVKFVLLPKAAIHTQWPPFSSSICPDVLSIYGLNTIGNDWVVFRKELFSIN